MSEAVRAAAAVSESRLWERHMAMAKLGGLPAGGVNRQAYSPEDAAARNQLGAWARARGYAISTDAIGNLFVRRPGIDDSAAPVMSGSHMDSQPKGGKFDGMYGVLAALEALEAMDDAGVRTRRPVEAVAWADEEGSRFQPGCIGSAVFTGYSKLEDMLAVKDFDGKSLADALAETLAAAPAPMRGERPGFPLASYVEAHIEQGPRLEAEGRTIGVVTSIQAARRYMVEVLGEEAHAGTTPRSARKDAFVAALRIGAKMQEIVADPPDALRFTIGRFDVFPGSPNTVPGRVRFSIDMRHPSVDLLDATEARLREAVRTLAAPCSSSIERLVATPTITFHDEIVSLVRRQAAALGLPHMDMPSGAGHDAGYVAKICPAGMIFVPCARGVSHNESESATSGDLAAGARVLTATLVELANA